MQAVEEPTLEHSAQLMAECDLVLATGAFGLTKAAYSSGTPAYGVGPGNPPVVLDRGYDLTDAVKMTITAVGSDNGILCDGDNMLLHPAEEEKALFDTMRQEGVVVFDKPEDVDKFREVLFVNGKSNPALVGKDAPVIAKAAGFDIPESTKVIALKVSAVGSADILNKEIMGPVVVTKGYDTFEEAVAMAIQNMTESGGIGHTAGIFSNDEEHIRLLQRADSRGPRACQPAHPRRLGSRHQLPVSRRVRGLRLLGQQHSRGQCGLHPPHQRLQGRHAPEGGAARRREAFR